MSLETRTLSLVIIPEGEAIFHDAATIISIDDEAGGEFVVVSQEDYGYGKVAFEPSWWPTIREAIDRMIAECRDPH